MNNAGLNWAIDLPRRNKSFFGEPHTVQELEIARILSNGVKMGIHFYGVQNQKRPPRIGIFKYLEGHVIFPQSHIGS